MPDVLLATDADWIADDVAAALDGGDTLRRVRRGVDVTGEVVAATPDLVVLDLQIGNMGGMATCMSLHLDAGVGRLPDVPVLMLLDRPDDVFLARRSEADGWLVKPLDAFAFRRAVAALLAGGTWPGGPAARPEPADAPEGADGDESAEPADPGVVVADLETRKRRRTKA